MTFEEIQKAWQAQNDRPRLNIDADVLLRELRRNELGFDHAILWRDVREIGAAVLMIAAVFYVTVIWEIWPFFISHQRWPAVPISLALIWVAGFLLFDRRRRRGDQLVASDPLRYCIESSLQKIEHQIRLLDRVFWWYLLPLLVGIAGFMLPVFWEVELMARQAERAAAPGDASAVGIVVRLVGFASVGLGCLITVFSFRFVYWLNKNAIRTQLEPRRQELKSLLISLNLDEK